MLEPILGSVNAERVLMFILFRTEGYAREIARYYGTDLDPIQKQLEKFEVGGVLVSKPVGKTIVYQFNPRYAFLDELQTLLKAAFGFYSKEDQDRLANARRRPRRKGKPL